MDLGEVLDFFGGTIFFEEYRGNFTDLSRLLTEREHSQDGSSKDNEGASMLLRSILHAQLGDIDQGMKLLHALECFGDRWAYRCHIYQALLIVWADCPPMFSCWSVRSTMGHRLWFRDHRIQTLSRTHHYLEKYGNDQDSATQNEWGLIKLVLDVLGTHSEIARSLNPEVDNLSNDKRIDLLALMEETQRRIGKFLEIYSEARFTKLVGYLHQLSYRLLHFQCSPTEGASMSALKHYYQQTNDIHGLGLYHILKGNQLVSSPLSSLILLNAELVTKPGEFESVCENNSLIVQDVRRAPQELDILPSRAGPTLMSHVEGALLHFRKAQTLFTRAQSPRGIAIAGLLIALIALARGRALTATPLFGSKELHEQFLSVKQLFITSGDILSQQLVHLHLTLFPLKVKTIILNAGQIDAIQPRIGEYAEHTKNQAFALCLSLLATQIGSHSLRDNDSNHAIHCYQIALHMISSIPIFIPVQIGVLLKLASLYAARGDCHTAIEWSSLALGMSLRLLDSLWMASDGNIDNRKESADHSILHLQMNSETGGVIIRGRGLPSDESNANHLRTSTYLLWLKQAMDSNITIDLQSAKISRVDESSRHRKETYAEHFNHISLFDENESSREWISHQRCRLEYLDALMDFKLCLQKLKTSAALDVANKFLSLGASDLRRKGHMIEMAARCGNSNKARNIMTTIRDEDLIPLSAISTSLPGECLNVLSESHRHRTLCSHELILACAIQSRHWSRARELMKDLEKLAPGYFTSGPNHEGFGPGQKQMYAALIYANNDRPDIAWVFTIRAITEITRARVKIRLMNRSDFDNMANASRVANMLVPLALQLEKTAKMSNTERTSTETENSWPSHETDPEISRTRSMMTTFNALDLIEMVRARTITDWVSQERGSSRAYLEITRKMRTWEHLSRRRGDLDIPEREELAQLNSEIDSLIEIEEALSTGASDKADAPDSRSLSTFLTSIQDGNLVVYTSVSDDGLALFALESDGIKHVCWNSDAAAPQVKLLVSEYLESIVSSKGHLLSETTKKLGMTLSRWLLDPILEYMDNKTSIIFVPSGDLMRIPFSALPYKSSYLFLHKAVSQIPSLTTLFYLNLNNYRRLPNFDLPSNKFCTVVAKPGNAREARKLGGEPELRMAGVEAVMISQLYETKALHAANMSREAFRNHLSSSGIFHIVTHGYFNADHPLDSHISLKERFRLVDLIGTSAKPILVIFSACLTGLGESNDNGDFLGFSHSLLTAGATNFIGALWNASDVATMIHMYLFHQEILDSTMKTVESCWQIATIALYNMKPDDVVQLLTNWIARWDEIHEKCEYEAEFIKNGKRKIQSVVDELTTPMGKEMLDFKHPYIWAPFVLVGRAGVRFSSTRTQRKVPNQDSSLVDGKPQCATQ